VRSLSTWVACFGTELEDGMTKFKRHGWLLAIALLLTTASSSSAQTRHISLDEYLAMHDYTEAGYFEGWNNPATPDVWVYFDPLGSREAYLGGDVGTTVTGSVSVRPLSDGRGLVTVLIHSDNALCWAYDSALAASNVFGATPRQVVLLGATPSFGHGTERIEFTMPSVDTPLPPLWELWTETFPVTSVVAEFTCQGGLTAASGYPAGMAAMAHVTQRGPLVTGVVGRCAAGDCWPAELAFYKPTQK
jgi:hypothetical protein